MIIILLLHAGCFAYHHVYRSTTYLSGGIFLGSDRALLEPVRWPEEEEEESLTHKEFRAAQLEPTLICWRRG